MNRIFHYALLMTIAVLAVFAGFADENLSSARLLIAHKTVRPGERLPVAVKITVADGWHTYAKEPGDFGMPPSIKINGVDGLEVSEWRFPPPETFADSAGTSYGYEHEVVLFSDVLIPETVLVGQTIELTASFKWMICKDICVFQQGTQTIIVQVGAASSEPAAEWQSLSKENP